VAPALGTRVRTPAAAPVPVPAPVPVLWRIVRCRRAVVWGALLLDAGAGVALATPSAASPLGIHLLTPTQTVRLV